MPASVFESRLVLNRKPAWHNLGKVMDTPMTAIEAGHISGVSGITYSKFPLSAWGEHGEEILIPDRVALFRNATDESESQFVDLVHPNYPIIPNARLAEFLNPLSKDRPVETVGALGDGTTVFFTLQGKPVDIGGDECGQFFVVVDYKTPGKALRILETKVRIVCQNTLLAGISAANFSIKIPHSHRGFEGDVKFYVDLRHRMDQAASSSTEVFERMAHTSLKQIQEEINFADPVAALLKYVFPTPEKPDSIAMMDAAKAVVAQSVELDDRRAKAIKDYDRQVEMARQKRDDVVELHAKFNDEFPRTANTAWSLYNVVVEYADHRLGFQESFTPRFRAEQALFGKRASEKTRAFDALTNSTVLARALARA